MNDFPEVYIQHVFRHRVYTSSSTVSKSTRKYHWSFDAGNTRALCNGSIGLDSVNSFSPMMVPKSRRCRSRACRQRWDWFDKRLAELDGRAFAIQQLRQRFPGSGEIVTTGANHRTYRWWMTLCLEVLPFDVKCCGGRSGLDNISVSGGGEYYRDFEDFDELEQWLQAQYRELGRLFGFIIDLPLPQPLVTAPRVGSVL